MDTVKILSAEKIGRNYISKEYLPDGKDEYYIRNEQHPDSSSTYRHLTPAEIEQLEKNGNSSPNWDGLMVSEEFEVSQLKSNEFYGLVRIGRVRSVLLEYHNLQVPAGITNSKIIACDIADDVAIHNVGYLAHIIIGNRTIMMNIGEFLCTDNAKFGNGSLKDGEPESDRAWLEVVNEAGYRKIIPFDSMITADALLWSKYRDDRQLQDKLVEITQNGFDRRRGYYGTIGEQCVIKNSGTLHDVKIGSHCYINGATKLENLTINSNAQEPTQIGESVELVDGIVGCGSCITYGSKAISFIMGNNTNLNYGARMIHSILGDNSTISCCEVLNNLIFPGHEQHHNNSFLIATLVMGQSNIAAGATIGSNHNSRGYDNEVQAGRGFWPGLCTSIKHPCRFASFVLLAKGDYPAELDIPLPFSLLNNNVSSNQLEVMPAYWWLYNMYALARNTWKYQHRDKRIMKTQHIEFDSLAPDTIEEIFTAIELLEIWTAKVHLIKENVSYDAADRDYLRKTGFELLMTKPDNVKQLRIQGEKMEKSKRDVVIINTAKAYRAYNQMLLYYAIKNLIAYMETGTNIDFSKMSKNLAGGRVKEWTNLGGQLIHTKEIDKLRAEIGAGKLNSWDMIHQRYDTLWTEYPLHKQQHAFATWCSLLGKPEPALQDWQESLEKAVSVQEYISEQVYVTRKKDYDNPFMQSTYRNREEMIAAIGTIEDNSFIQQVREETNIFKEKINDILNRK